MSKIGCLVLLLLAHGALANVAYQDNIFVLNEKPVTFLYEAQLVEYLQNEKPVTYQIYRRLDKTAQRAIYVQQLKHENEAVTTTVMRVYKKHKNKN